MKPTQQFHIEEGTHQIHQTILCRNLSRHNNLFVSLCKLYQQQKSVTSHSKKPITNPIKANQFFAHVQVDLIDFRNLPCECQSKHNWVLHIVDHFSKLSWMFAMNNKQTEEVAVTLTNLFCLHFDELTEQVHTNKCKF